MCWNKCVTGSLRNGKLDRNEENCAKNCVDRFLDGNLAIVKYLESTRNTL